MDLLAFPSPHLPDIWVGLPFRHTSLIIDPQASVSTIFHPPLSLCLVKFYHFSSNRLFHSTVKGPKFIEKAKENLLTGGEIKNVKIVFFDNQPISNGKVHIFLPGSFSGLTWLSASHLWRSQHNTHEHCVPAFCESWLLWYSVQPLIRYCPIFVYRVCKYSVGGWSI